MTLVLLLPLLLGSATIQAREPLTYTPSYLAEKILTSRSALTSTRRWPCSSGVGLPSTLKRQFQLDDAALDDLKDALIYGQRLAGWMKTSACWSGEGTLPPHPPLPPRPRHAPAPWPPPRAPRREDSLSRSALEGERKQVTVLFADLKGSMELLAERDPEEARQLLDPVLERMIEAVHRYEGTVNQVMGDGIMALFGAPIAHEDHAVRACYAALRMQETVTRYGDAVQRSHGVPVQIRVGLNSGAVVVRAIDSSLHMDYTAVGQTTHLAARMEQMATPGSVLTTGETLRLAEGLVQVKALGPRLGQGAGRPRGGVRAGRRQLHPDAYAGVCGPWAHPLRRAAGGVRGPAPGLGARWHQPRPGRGGDWGARGGQDPPGLRVHPLPSHPRLARARKQLGLLRQGHRLPPRARPAQGLLSD